MEKKINVLFEILSDLISADGTWQEKKAMVLGLASEGDMTNLEEFVAWFDVEE